VNLGIAAATPRGLMVPNIKSARTLGLRELATALTVTAKEGKTGPADLADGTITITNVGVFGVDAGTPILNPGEAAILCFGSIHRRPWEYQGEITLRSITTLSLTFDHRLVDGEQGSKFLATLADREGSGPTLIEAVTYRMGPHTTSDDPSRYRPAAFDEEWKAKDPLDRLRALLESAGVIDDGYLAAVQQRADDTAAALRRGCLETVEPTPMSMFDTSTPNRTPSSTRNAASSRPTSTPWKEATDDRHGHRAHPSAGQGPQRRPATRPGGRPEGRAARVRAPPGSP
jgi:hypothetical protein